MLKYIMAYAFFFVVGALLFYFLTFSLNNSISIPMGMMGLLLLPIGVCSQVIYKTNELKESNFLSSSEVRRLEIIINYKIRRCFAWILFYIFTALILVIVFYLGEAKSSYIRESVIFSGGLFGISLSSIFHLHKKYLETSDFKAHLIQRENKRKRQKDLLDGMENNKDK